MTSGMQLGIFERQESNPRKRKYCGMFTDIVALKTSDSYCHFLSTEEKERGTGVTSLENLKNRTFPILRKCPFDMWRTLQKGTLLIC